MTQIVSITLPDDVFAALERKAESQGQTVVELAAAVIASNVSRQPEPTPETKTSPSVNVRSLFGSATGVGDVANEAIDQDLARQYQGPSR